MKSGLPGFAGIALADILANGVAVMILLIVITIGTQYAREQEQLEQVDEVSLALSRDLAVAMVQNNLSASAPAYLHDYHNSPQDRRLDPRVMPILEMRRNTVRDHYTGKIWQRGELLQEDNDLDRHLAGFSPTQRRFIRLDIYDIPLFYILTSILRAHGISPGHWHFIGADAAARGDARGGGKDGENGGEDGDADAENGDADAENGGDTAADGDDGEPMAAGRGGLPGDVDIAYGGGGARYSPDAPQSPSAAGSPNEAAVDIDAAGAPLLGRARFRLAGQADAAAAPWQPTAAPRLEDVLAALLALLHDWQQTYDRGASPTASIAALSAGIGDAIERQTAPLGSSDSRTVENLVAHFTAYWPASEQRLAVSAERRSRPGPGTLRLLANQPLQTAAVAADTRAFVLRQLPGDKQVTLAVSRYPGLLSGVIALGERDAVLLMPARQQAMDQLRWRAVTLISPTFDDFTLGFVYAALQQREDALELLLAVDENIVSLDGAALYSQPQAVPRSDRWLLFFATLGICVLAAELMRRWARTRRRGAAARATLVAGG